MNTTSATRSPTSGSRSSTGCGNPGSPTPWSPIRETGMYADFRKVHPIDFTGKYFKSRGPLNMPPGPQRRPVICQAGMSPAGREFAAKYADTIVAVCRGAAAAKRYRDDVAAAHGARTAAIPTTAR